MDNMLPKMFVALKPELESIISNILRVLPSSVLIKMKNHEEISRALMELNDENVPILVSIKTANDRNSIDRLLNQLSSDIFVVELIDQIANSKVFQQFEPNVQVISISAPITKTIEGITNFILHFLYIISNS